MDTVSRPGMDWDLNIQQPCMAGVPRVARRDMSPSHRASWCFPGVAGRRAVEEERTCHFCCGNGQDLLRKGTLVSYRGGSGMDTLTTSIVSALHDLLLPCTARLWYWRCASSLLDLPLRILEARNGGCGGKARDSGRTAWRRPSRKSREVRVSEPESAFRLAAGYLVSPDDGQLRT